MHQWKFSHSSSLTVSKNLCHYSNGRNQGETLAFTGGLYHHIESTVAPHSQYKEAGLRIITHLSSSNINTGVTWQSTFHRGSGVILQISHCLLIFTVNMRSLQNTCTFTHFSVCFSFFHSLSLAHTYLRSCEMDGNWNSNRFSQTDISMPQAPHQIFLPCMMKTKTSQCLNTKFHYDIFFKNYMG